MVTSRVRLACLCAVLLSLLSACGGGEDPAPPPPRERPPTAAAGADQTVNKRTGVTLSAAASTDPEGSALAYRWTQTSGPVVALSSTTSASPVFTAPGQSAVLVFSLTVNDGRVDSVADSVQVTVANRAPVANAGADVTVGTGVLNTLNGTGSADPDSDDLSFEWVQLSGLPVTMLQISPGLWRFTTPGVATRLEFALTAHDGEQRSAADIVVVTVQSGISNNVPQAETAGDFTISRRTAVQLPGSATIPTAPS